MYIKKFWKPYRLLEYVKSVVLPSQIIPNKKNYPLLNKKGKTKLLNKTRT